MFNFKKEDLNIKSKETLLILNKKNQNKEKIKRMISQLNKAFIKGSNSNSNEKRWKKIKQELVYNEIITRNCDYENLYQKYFNINPQQKDTLKEEVLVLLRNGLSKKIKLSKTKLNVLNMLLELVINENEINKKELSDIKLHHQYEDLVNNYYYVLIESTPKKNKKKAFRNILINEKYLTEPNEAFYFLKELLNVVNKARMLGAKKGKSSGIDKALLQPKKIKEAQVEELIHWESKLKEKNATNKPSIELLDSIIKESEIIKSNLKRKRKKSLFIDDQKTVKEKRRIVELLETHNLQNNFHTMSCSYGDLKLEENPLYASYKAGLITISEVDLKDCDILKEVKEFNLTSSFINEINQNKKLLKAINKDEFYIVNNSKKLEKIYREVKLKKQI